MFGYDGYTLAEVAELFDCSEEGIASSFSAFMHRKYWLFGPTLYEKEAIDEMAPQIRANMKLLGTTRADNAARRQELERLQQQTKQHEANIAETQRRMLEEREAFNKQIEEMVRRKFERDNQ